MLTAQSPSPCGRCSLEQGGANGTGTRTRVPGDSRSRMRQTSLNVAKRGRRCEFTRLSQGFVSGGIVWGRSLLILGLPSLELRS